MHVAGRTRGAAEGITPLAARPLHRTPPGLAHQPQRGGKRGGRDGGSTPASREGPAQQSTPPTLPSPSSSSFAACARGIAAERLGVAGRKGEGEERGRERRRPEIAHQGGFDGGKQAQRQSQGRREVGGEEEEEGGARVHPALLLLDPHRIKERQEVWPLSLQRHRAEHALASLPPSLGPWI